MANDLGGAFHAYSLVSELDRRNAEALQILADLSLARGQVRDALRYADQLELLQPGSPGPIVTRGFAALARSRPDDALRAADQALAIVPNEEAAVILKARALDAKGSNGEATRVLEAQLVARGPSKPLLDSMLALYRKGGNDAGVLRTRARLVALTPNDPAMALDYARDLYRAGDREAGRRATLQVLGTGKEPRHLEDVLALWAAHEPREQARRNAQPLLAAAAGPSQRASLGHFLLEIGRADEAEALLRAQAASSPSSENANGLAVYAAARAAQGHAEEARRLLDSVLAFDPSNVVALRARTDLHLAAGRTDQALADARRLVAESPSTAEDRVRLAACYVMGGQGALAESTYWQAFNELPGNPVIYDALKSHLRGAGKAANVALLDRRYAEQLQTLRSRRA